ncbi:uncharacterized protein BT62DRAFT_1043294 [Guyanagaster necrorhizus]|uniref:Protein kinase domain-containing protein n=1 Tax=Guyanagaster necrorhizus TaxID=856835 RepID=A0A9P7VIM1_9AGAR|nr:uncharacterized protein BT62DRAFT_1043294 [Guyanagaster necrorhizus MCA 3950]KAG7441302.1 hypothetical protein BT62DRAFT_1043294 [Guyanagaster necrorhizus MCA 3950]
MTRRPAFPPFEDLSSPREFFWVKHQPYLQSQGYMLRPRYHPDWRPSWIQKDGTNLKEKYSFLIFQDQHRSIYISTIIDAIRMEDGVKVVLRIVPVGSLELAMMMHLSSPKMPSDPRNHTVPVLGTIPIPGEENDRVFVISPVLRWFHSPDFHCRREFADAFRQILEVGYCILRSRAHLTTKKGIDFMHENNIAHGNVALEVHGFTSDIGSIDGLRLGLQARPRCLVPPVKYYIIDFETTRHYPEGKDAARAIALKCQIKTSPEFLSAPAPYNPFRLDVYNVGATFLSFCEKYAGVDEFKPFCVEMMAKDPSERPTTKEMLRKFDVFIGSKDQIWLRSRIWLDYAWYKPRSRFVQFLWRKFPILLPYF